MAIAAVRATAMIALGAGSIVTRGAGHAGNRRMHHLAGRRRAAAVEARGARVTDAAIGRGGRDMAGALDDNARVGTAVARCASSGDAGMTERRPNEARGAGVAQAAVLAGLGREVVRRLALCAGGALADEAATVAGAAQNARHRRVVHCVGREACRGVGMAVAALDGSDRNVWRRGHAGCSGAVVAARAIGIGGGMDERRARKAARALVAGRAVLAVGRDVTRE